MSRPRRLTIATLVPCLVLAALACAPLAARAADAALTEHPGEVLIALETAYRTRDVGALGALLTADYRFHPYDEAGRRWDESGFTRDFELQSARCMLRTVEDTTCRMPAPTWMRFRLRGVRLTDDPEHPDSTEHYALAITQDFQWALGRPDGDSMVTLPSTHVFHLVRGDVAQLVPGQLADARHWYIRRWIERATARGPGDGVDPAPTGTLSPGELALRIDQNPSGRDLAVWFTLGSEAPGYFTVFDVQGRRRVTRTVPGEGGPRLGERRLALGLAARLESGIYWVRLEQRGWPSTTKMVTVR